MNKKIKLLASSLMAVSASASVFATQSSKTSFNHMLGVHDVASISMSSLLRSAVKEKKGAGGVLTVYMTYAKSNNGTDVGKAFATGNSNSVTVERACDLTIETTKLNANEVLHYSTASCTANPAVYNELAGTATLSPEETVYGAGIEYRQDFSGIKGLNFGVKLAVERRKHELKADLATSHNGADSTESIGVADVFTGRSLSRTSSDDTQAALKNAKIIDESKDGVTDLQADLGYNFIDDSKKTFGAYATIVFPTSSDHSVETLWAARNGLNKWQAGVGIRGRASLWNDEAKEKEFFLHGDLEYRYQFSRTEKRVVPLKTAYQDSTTSVSDPLWSQYIVVGEVGQKGVMPLANVSALDVKVDSRSHVDAYVAVSYKASNVGLDLGYNFSWSGDEKLTIDSAWSDTKYGIAVVGYKASANFTTADATKMISSTDFDLDRAATQSAASHRIFGTVAYVSSKSEFPLGVGAGVYYQFPGDAQNGLEGYGAWIKAGVGF